MEKTRIIFAGNYDFQNSNILTLADYMENISIAGIMETGENTLTLYKLLNPQIIFIDAYLEGLNGFEVARFIKEQDKAIKIIIVSENFNYDFFVLSREMNLNGYLPKNSPIEFISLILRSITSRERCFDLFSIHPLSRLANS